MISPKFLRYLKKLIRELAKIEQLLKKQMKLKILFFIHEY